MVGVSQALFLAMRVIVQEPEHRNNEAAKEDKQHFEPGTATFIKLSSDNLTTSYINEGATRKAQEDNIDEFVTIWDWHADDDSNRGDDRKDRKEQHDLFNRISCAGESSTKWDGSSWLVNEDSDR